VVIAGSEAGGVALQAVQLTREETIEVVDVPEPVPVDDQVLVQVEHLSICGSDMRYYRSPNSDDFPFPPGYPFHECAGRVVDRAGAGFAEGDAVVVLAPDRLAGAELLAVSPRRLVKVPDKASLPTDERRVLAQPLGTVLYPCGSLNGLGKSVVVFGQGPLGLTFTQLLSGMRSLHLVSVDLHDYRLAHARRLGATATFTPGDDVAAEVRALTDGRGADIVVDTTGREDVINLALEILAFRGTLSCFGQPVVEPIGFNYKTFSKKEIHLLPTITHSRPDPAEGTRLAVDLIVGGRIDVSWMVTHRLPLSEVGKAFEIYATQAEECLKVVLHP